MTRMICARCDKPILPGAPYDTHIHHGATLAGCTNHTHRACSQPEHPDRARRTAPPQPTGRT